MLKKRVGVVAIGLVLGLASCGTQTVPIESVEAQIALENTNEAALEAQAVEYCNSVTAVAMCGHIGNNSKGYNVVITYDLGNPEYNKAVLKPGQKSVWTKDADAYWAPTQCTVNGKYYAKGQWVKVQPPIFHWVNIKC